MALEVYELRAEDAADAAALWQGGDASWPDLDAARKSAGGLVLVARDDGRLVAVVACMRDVGKGHVMHVATAAGDGAEALRRNITGIAMRKLRSRGISKCHVAVAAADAEQAEPFFASLRFNIPPTASSDAA